MEIMIGLAAAAMVAIALYLTCQSEETVRERGARRTEHRVARRAIRAIQAARFWKFCAWTVFVVLLSIAVHEIVGAIGLVPFLLVCLLLHEPRISR